VYRNRRHYEERIRRVEVGLVPVFRPDDYGLYHYIAGLPDWKPYAVALEIITTKIHERNWQCNE
jgi:hypothetical protein